MKYYRLVGNSWLTYGYFQKDTIYREDARTDNGFPLLTCISDNPGHWEEVIGFKFGRPYIGEEMYSTVKFPIVNRTFV